MKSVFFSKTYCIKLSMDIHIKFLSNQKKKIELESVQITSYYLRIQRYLAIVKIRHIIHNICHRGTHHNIILYVCRIRTNC